MSDVFDVAALGELVTLLREQNEADVRKAGWDKVHSLMVAPDVWARLQSEVPPCDAGSAPIIGVSVLVNRHLSPGQMVPLDREGKPILRSTSAPPTSTKGTP